jgi:hypothetical protein
MTVEPLLAEPAREVSDATDHNDLSSSMRASGLLKNHSVAAPDRLPAATVCSNSSGDRYPSAEWSRKRV